MAKRFLTSIGLHTSINDPESGSDGEVYFNLDSSELRIYYNGTWNPVGSGGEAGSVESGVQLSTTWWLGA